MKNDILAVYENEVRRTGDAMYANSDEIFKLMRICLGLTGEAGECADIIKKAADYNGSKLSDEAKEHLILEMGDVLWYLTNAAFALDIDLEKIMKENIAKSHRRYPNGFTIEDSKIHKD